MTDNLPNNPPSSAPLDRMEHLTPESKDMALDDPAMQSLADALRVSFRVLSILMVLFVLLFLATGVGSISAQEQGLIQVFGRITGVAKEGFVYNWPYPIGEIVKVNIQEQQIRIDDFWLFESSKDKLKELSKRSRQNTGLIPAQDGYLLTGDRNLIHIRFLCRYQVRDPVQLRTRLGELDPVLREALCQAAVQAAAIRTADAIQVDPTGFLADVKTLAQAELDTLLGARPGEHTVRINAVLSQDKTWPLAAYTAYEQAQKAKTQMQTQINQAVSEARDLTKVIGEKSFIELAGKPWDRDRQAEATQAREGKDAKGDAYNLIGHLTHLEQQKAQTGADEALEAIDAQLRRTREDIDTILTRATTGGEVRRIILAADSDKTRIIQQAERQAEAFEKLRAQYAKAPELFLQKTWALALDEIFNAPTNTKYYVHPGQKGDVVYIRPDPKVLKNIRDYQRQQKEQGK